MLKTLFDGDCATCDFRAGSLNNFDETVKRRSVGKEIVDDKNSFACRKIIFADYDYIAFFMRITVNFSRLYIARNVLRTALFRIYGGNAEFMRDADRKRNARSLDRENFIDFFAREKSGNLVTHAHKKLNV